LLLVQCAQTVLKLQSKHEELQANTIVVQGNNFAQLPKAGLHNIRPAKDILEARESFLTCRKCCKSSTSSK